MSEELPPPEWRQNKPICPLCKSHLVHEDDFYDCDYCGYLWVGTNDFPKYVAQ